MSMTRDKAGGFIFQKGKRYKPTVMFNPIWSPLVGATCVDVRKEGKEGLFTVGDDSRWYNATDQFEEA